MLLGWWLLFQFAERYNPEAWFILPLIAWVLFGPAICAVAASAPAFRGADVSRAGLAAAIVPVLAWYWRYGHGSTDSGALWAILMPMAATLVLAGAAGAWCVGAVLAVVQDEKPQAT